MCCSILLALGNLKRDDYAIHQICLRKDASL